MISCAFVRVPSVSKERRVDLGGDAAGDDPQDLLAEIDEDAIDDRRDERVAGERRRFQIHHRLVNERRVGLLLGGLEDERGIRRRILRAVGAHRFEIARVGDDDSV